MGTMNRLADFTWFRTIHQLDVRSFYWLLTRRHARTLARFARIVSHSADGFYYPLAGWWLWYHDLVVGAYALALTFVLERPIYKLLKNSFRRNRPADILENFRSFITPSDRFSFPSGHTSGAFVVTTILTASQPELFWPLYGWAVLVGWSRVQLGVHFPTDTLMGALLGSGAAALSLNITQGWII